ncbi:hypothetical protein [Hymenobacter canadensis]|uniref:HTH cro/C1-type domain-containing protein n=1 Tax=Hymenobacter canadensis TaxID=2999067 RepID=A0ABY7LXL7_9BACT|nr:hypothetical protein [Hymenobacter canadensis]WBA44020.1 hypothetical protein O3303_20885 [Hymenobacter canadensis]
MSTETGLPAADAPTRVPFRQASAPLIAKAMSFTLQWLTQYFPDPSWPTLEEAFLRQQPDLLVKGEQVFLHWHDLHRLARHLEALSGPDGARPAQPATDADADVPADEAKASTGPAPRPRAAARRTLSSIIHYHPRPDGKAGFTVRELCRTMRIGAESLTDAQQNPGRLSLSAIEALAEKMQESPVQLVVDLLAEMGARRKPRRKARVRVTAH